MRLLHPALWTLLRLRALSGVRRSLHALRSFRSAVVFLLGLSVIGLVVSVVLGGGIVLAEVEPARLAALYQSGLLTFLLVGQIKTLGDRAVYFSPSEVDFLFAGPFSRRELIVYRVISALGGILVLSALLTALFVSLGGWWPTVFLGALLSFLLLHQLAMCLATLRETVEAHAFSVARRVLVLAVLGLVAGSIAYAVSAQSGLPSASATAFGFESGHGTLGLLSAAYGSWTMQALLLPFVPFSEVVTARGFDLSAFGWITACLLINAGPLRCWCGWMQATCARWRC